MATPKPTGDDAKKSKSWRGGGQNKKEKVAQHRWQKDWTKEQDQERLKHNRWHRVKIGTFGLLAMALIAYFIYVLIYSPPKTPFVALAVHDYKWPLPPNAWALEDLQRFSQLDEETIDWADLSPQWKSSRQLGLKHLNQQLDELGSGNRPVIVIYLSMHGVVNAKGEPCLLPVDADPLDESTWMPLADVLDAIKQRNLPPEMPKLLVLDCNRIDINWHMGVLQNGFAESIDSAVKAVNVHNLAVLNSTSGGQVGWASPDLGGSVFGYYFFRGFGGGADADGSGTVTIHELQNYLASHVNQWVTENRADRQVPMLIYSGSEDFQVSFSKKGGLPQLPPPEKPSKTVISGIASLWKKHESLSEQARPYRYSPLAWRDFEHGLLRLEQLTLSGSYYGNEAKSLLSSLKQRAASMDFGTQASALPAHSVGLAAHFRRGGKDEYLQKVAAAWKSLEQAPNKEQLSDEVSRLGPPSTKFRPGGLAEAQFLRMLDQHLDPEVWKRPELIGQAIRTRGLAEAVASDTALEKAERKPDERVQYWVRTTVDAGDGQLRQAEDLLYLGDGDSLAAAQKNWKEAQVRYERSMRMANTVGAALDLRDKMWAELPYIAQWLTRRFPAGQQSEQADADNRIQKELLPLVADVHAFAAYLESTLPADALAVEPPGDELDLAEQELNRRTEDIRRRFERLRTLYDKRCEDLTSTSGEDQRTLREVAAALSIPLVNAKDRTKLNENYRTISAKIYSRQGKLSRGAGSSANVESGTYKKRMASWGSHPVVALVSPAADEGLKEPAPKTPIYEQSGWVRHVLQAAPEEVRMLPKKLDALRNPDEMSVRKEYFRVDRIARIVGPLALDIRTEEPAIQMQKLNFRHLLLWHARRTLDDFWGPPAPRENPYFDEVAADYLQVAKTVWQTQTGARPQFENELELLNKRRDASIQGIRPDTYNVPISGEEEFVPHSITPSVPDGMPPGKAAVFVLDSESGEEVPLHGRVDHRRLELDIPSQKVTLSYTLSEKELAHERYEAVALYRGHRFANPFLARRPQGPEIYVRVPDPLPPRIMVQGRNRKQASVVLILDCSGSMNDLVRLEGGQVATRMEVARKAFLALMDEMLAEGNYRVGAFLYGHRVGWKPMTRTLLQQTDYAHKIPENLQPYEDVEEIRRVGRFDRKQRDEIAELLATVKAWGETPLYFAINEALQSFDPNDNSQKSVIVLTDGKDNVFQPPNDKKVTKEMVLRSRGSRPISIYVVSFQLAAEERNEAVKDFSELAKATGGKYFEATNPNELTLYLKKSLETVGYEVDSQGQKIVEGRVGKSVEVPAPEHRKIYTVQVQTREGRKVETNVALEGGEFIELTLDDQGRELDHARYLKGSPVFSNSVTDPSGHGEFVLGAHRPEWLTGGQAGLPDAGAEVLSFPISIQNANAKLFSPRPVEAMVEITPKFQEGFQEAATYTFYDRSFENYTPVPVLRCMIPNWPKSADEATINAIWKYEPTTPDRSEKVGDASEKPEAERTIPGAAKVSYKVAVKPGSQPGWQRVSVFLTGPSSDAIRVNVRAPGEHPNPPEIIRRKLDRELGMAVHNLEFQNIDAVGIRDYLVEFTTVESLRQDALFLKKPVTIVIHKESGTVRTTGGR